MKFTLKSIALIVIVALSTLSCKKKETVTLDFHIEADTLAIDSLELMVKEIWINYSDAKDKYLWHKMENVNQLMAWHDYSNTLDSVFLKGIILENANVIQQVRFVIDPSKSRGIMATDTFGIVLEDPMLGIQALTNKKVEKNMTYKANFKWTMEDAEWVDTLYQIKPVIKAIAFTQQ